MELNFANIEDVANQAFDYIVVGGGVAGSVVASLLSEKSDITVLLLEAGKGRSNDPLIGTPVGGTRGYQLGIPEYDWAFQTLLTANCSSYCFEDSSKESQWKKDDMEPVRIPKSTIFNPTDPDVYRGKGLGGSSNINQMMWTRPGRVELGAWEKLGNPGWSYKDIIPYIQKVENFHPPSNETIKAKLLATEQPWFGKNGPISLAFCEVLTGLEETIRNTITSSGIPAINNAPLGEYTGLYNCPSTVDPVKLERSSAFKGYIQPHLNRKNLFVLPESYVTKLLWKNDSKPNGNGEFTAEGVEFIFEGKTFVAHSVKEVLLTAGALKSSQLLELSGIGRPDVLNPLDVPVLVDLPGVGENLQEHYCGNAIVFELHPNAAYRTVDLLNDPVEDEKYEELYKMKRRKELIEIHVKDLANRIASMDTDISKGLKEQLDLQLERLKDPRLPTVELTIVARFLDHPNKSEPKKLYLSFLSGLVGTWSRGSAHISSTNPLDPLQLDANALEYPFELDLLTEEFKFTRKLRDCEPLKSIIAKEIAPGNTVVTDEQIRERVKNTFRTMWHTSGTFSMLPREKNGIVDTSLKVYGTTNVRVCDLSIPPLQAVMHTQCLAYAIAEKAADIILGRA